MSSINKRQVSINVIINLAVVEFYLIPGSLMDFSGDETRCWGLKSGSNRGELCLSAVVANISFQYWASTGLLSYIDLDNFSDKKPQ